MLASLAFPVCYTTALLALGTIPLLHLLIGFHGETLFFWRVRTTELELQLVLYLMTLSVSAFLRYVAQVRRTEQRAAELALEKSRLESALRQAELETLGMRLNPHFLFNCLQNISALAGQGAAAASTMLARLGDLLRVALRSDYTAEITLDEEVALSRPYVSIGQVRYGSRLSVLFDLEPEAGRVLVPSLLLQPLIENAIKHGLVGRNAGVIWVRADLQNGRLLLTVRDNGIGLDREGASKLAPGGGLSATRARLSRMYGDEQHFSLIGMPEGGTEVKMILPLRRATPASNAHRLSEGWSECSSICLLGERSEISRH